MKLKYEHDKLIQRGKLPGSLPPSLSLACSNYVLFKDREINNKRDKVQEKERKERDSKKRRRVQIKPQQ